MAELIQRGGPTMLMILGLGALGLVLVLLHVVLARAWSAWLSTAVIAAILAIGLYGTLTARAITDRAVAAAREHGDELRAEGYKEARLPIGAASLVNGVFALGVVIGELRRRRR